MFLKFVVLPAPAILALVIISAANGGCKRYVQGKSTVDLASPRPNRALAAPTTLRQFFQKSRENVCVRF